MRLLLASLTLFAATVALAAGTRELADVSLPWGGDNTAKPAFARAAALAALGQKLFVDPGLSASGTQSCATCHDPAHRFSPANSRAVQLGGALGDVAGTRATPGLTYVASTPFFTEHYYESDEDGGDESVDQGPAGGRTWDGRVNRARDQAVIPLLSPREMANPDKARVVAHAARASYAADLKALFGARIFADTPRAFAALGEALEVYQQTPSVFSPFTSKFDAFLRGQVDLTPQERRGLEAFNDPERGNCVRCHRSQLSASGTLPMFTDAGLVAIGVPRNREIPANADPAYFDLGMCGPERTDLAGRTEYCGRFKAPTLRNVALRGAFYHNGVMHSLRDAVAFYATRDTNPERWYPRRADGTVAKFDDLPAPYRDNLDHEAPFGRRPGDMPALTDAQIDDIVAFLNTLTDGYTPPHPAAMTARQTLAP